MTELSEEKALLLITGVIASLRFFFAKIGGFE